MALPKNRREPTNCAGGWFYVNQGSITVVATNHATHGATQAKVTRRQMLAAIKIMGKRTTKNRGTKP